MADDFTENKMVVTLNWDKDYDLDSHMVIPLDSATDCNTTDGNSIQKRPIMEIRQ